MRSPVSFASIVLLQVALWGCTASDPLYCERIEDCNNGFYCHMASRTCLAVEGDGGARPKGSTCTQAAQCQSGRCADGVCCDKDCKGTCEACNLGGSVGTCSLVPASAGEQPECPGDSKCGNGTCNGKGACDYKRAGQPCGTGSCTAGKETQPTCSSAHKCEDKTSLCSPHTCDSAGKVCMTGCITDKGCVTGSLCDRLEAHTNGQGICVDPAKVVVVGAAEEIADALARVTASKYYVSVPFKSADYTKKISIVPGTLASGVSRLHIVGDSRSGSMPALDPSEDNVPGVYLAADVHLVLQFVLLKGASEQEGIGVKVAGASKTALTVLESLINSNDAFGIYTTNADVVLRRSVISNNGQGSGISNSGGLVIGSGKATMVNNVVVGNKCLSSALSPIKLVSLVALTFYNNTVYDNQDCTTAASLGCEGSLGTVYNSIFYHKSSTVTEVSGCTVEYSVVRGGAPGTGNIADDPQIVSVGQPSSTSPVIDKGTSVSGITALDIKGNARPQGKGVDMGAYEVK